MLLAAQCGLAPLLADGHVPSACSGAICRYRSGGSHTDHNLHSTPFYSKRHSKLGAETKKSDAPRILCPPPSRPRIVHRTADCIGHCMAWGYLMFCSGLAHKSGTQVRHRCNLWQASPTLQRRVPLSILRFAHLMGLRFKLGAEASCMNHIMVI